MKDIMRYYRDIFNNNYPDQAIESKDKINLSIYKSALKNFNSVGDRFYAPISDLYISDDENYDNLLVSRDFIKNENDEYKRINIYDNCSDEDKFIPSLPLFISLLYRFFNCDGFDKLISTITPKFGYGVMNNLYLQSSIINWKESKIIHYPQSNNTDINYIKLFNISDLEDITRDLEKLETTYIKLNDLELIDDKFINALLCGSVKELKEISYIHNKEILINFPFNTLKNKNNTICFFSITEKNIIIDINRSRTLRSPFLYCRKIGNRI